MPSAIIGALRVVLGADTASFEAGIDKAKAKSGELKGLVAGMADAFAGLVAPAALAGAGVATLAAGMRAAQEALDFADELDATATKIGVSAEALQSLRFAAQDADIDAGTFDATLMSLNATLGALKTGVGDAKIRAAFEKLGISDDQLKSMRDASDLLPVLADNIGKLGTQAEQVQIAKKLGVEDMLPLLQRGSKGIADLTDQAQSLGLVLKDEVVTRMADMSREVEIADQRMGAASRTIGTALTPAFLALKNTTADAMNWLAQFIDQFNRVENRATESLRRQRTRAYNAMLQVQTWAPGPNRDEALAAAQKQLADIDRELGERFDAAKRLAAEERKAGSGGGGGLDPKVKDAKKKGETWAELFSKARQNRQDYLDRQENARTLFSKNEGVIDPKTLKVDLEESTLEGLQDGFDRARHTVYESYREVFASAAEAGIRGGSRGILSWFGWELERTIIDKLSTAMADAATGGGSGGKWFSTIGALFGIGANAAGTPNWRGGLTLVGEKGPELVSLPRGAAITPNHQMGRALGSVNQTFIIHAQGAVLAEGLIAEMRQVGAQAAVAGAQGGAGLTDDRMRKRARNRFR